MRVPPPATATATLAMPAALVALLGPGTADRVAGLGDATTYAGLLAGLAAVAVTTVSAGLVLLSTLTALACITRSRGRWARVARILTPRRHRAAIAVLLGASVLGPPVAAQADLDGIGPGPSRQVATGLRLPDLPVTPPSAHAPPTRRLPTEARHRVVVRPGDTLWSIARASLPSADPGNRATARAVDRWYAANRQVLGPDPDLIHPGALLDPPDPAAPTTDRSTR